jgi:O-antigen/teichoic acid export membrane protein
MSSPASLSPAGPPELASTSRALGWSFLNTVASKLGTMIIGIILARVLGPGEFGTFAVAIVALTAVLSCNELGVSLAIVRWKEDPRLIAPTVATLSIAGSALMTAFLLVAAPAFCEAMGAPAAVPVVQVMSLAVLVSGVVATPAALLQRDFLQRRRMVIDQVGIWVGAALSLILAVEGLGAMSLAVGRVAGSLASGVLFLALSPLRFRLGVDRAFLKPVLHFGLPLAGASVLVFAVGYVDQLIVGATLGPTTLGYYVMAFNLASWPVIVFSLPLRGVAPALFARLRGDQAQMRQTFGGLMRVLMAVSLPVCAALSGAAEPIVRLVYGEAWLPAAEALRWLGLVAATRIFGEIAYDYLVIEGRSRSILAAQGAWLVTLVPALFLGSRLGGLVGVAAGQLVVSLLVVVPIYSWMLHGCNLGSGELLRPILFPAVAAAVVWFASALAAMQIQPPLLSCALAGTVALLAAALLLSRERSVLAQFTHATS